MKQSAKPKAKYTRKVLFAGAVICTLMLLPIPAILAQSEGEGAGFGNDDQSPEPVGQTSPKEKTEIFGFLPGQSFERTAQSLRDASKTSRSKKIKLIIPGLTSEQTNIISRRLLWAESVEYMVDLVVFVLRSDLKDKMQKEQFGVWINDQIADAEKWARHHRRLAESVRRKDQVLQALKAAELKNIAEQHQATADDLRKFLKTLD
ncbi:MAG: hypothetical protein K8F25_13790 [Fimbriimonadaceae bacterium]|nr:hypothetical protein [Alphaproteobacteria bacterium]